MRILSVLACGLLAVAAGTAAAQTYPAKPIRLVVTFPTGGAPDTLARTISEKINPAWGQTVIVDNKPGAGGNIGAEFVARAAADGYTLVMGTVGTHSINGALYAKMPYDMVKDFAPVTLIASTPNLLVVNNVSDGRVFGEPENEVTILGADGSVESRPRATKAEVADGVWDAVVRVRTRA